MHRNPDKAEVIKAKTRLRRYGLTIEAHALLLAKQGGLCAVCRSAPAAGKVLAVDHNHDTGRVRGLLCTRCNNLVAAHEHPLSTAVKLFLKEHD